MDLSQPHKCGHDRCKQAPTSFASKSELVRHLKNFHIVEREESVSCPEDGCAKIFTSTSSFSQHLSKAHRSWRTETNVQHFIQPQNVTEHPSEDPCLAPAGTPVCSEEPQSNEAFNRIATFYLQLEAENLVPKSTVQKILDGVLCLNSLTHAAISEILIQELNGKILQTDLNSLLLRVRANDPVRNSHQKCVVGTDLSTDYLRKDYYEKHFEYQEPVLYIIGPDPTLKDHTIAYVSIRRTVENMLKDPSIQKQVDASFVEEIPERRSYGTVIKNYTDGSAYIKRAKLYGKKRFQIALFADAFNPTSSSSRVDNRYKTVGMYMALLNLKPISRSKLSSVKLVMLVLDSVLKKFRKECFDYVIRELKILLTDGILYREEKIPLTLEKINGDNLGQHMLGGFLESFNPNIEYPCRYCEVTNKVYLKKPWILGEKRTQESYNNCVAELKELKERLSVNGQLREDKVYSVKGIKLNSEFNDVPLFHVCQPHLSPCVGHDGFGGAWEYDMAMMISCFVNEKQWMTYDLINRRIQIFKFSGSDCTNVPAAVSASGVKLGGNEVQNWTLIRLFVFFVGDLVQDTSDNVWLLYLQMKSFIEYVCAPQLTVEQICHMKYLSTEYLKARSSEDLPIVLNTNAKTHYTAHFADLYELEGPLCQAWTLRFESKHALLGRVLEMSRTHVNVIATMAKKDQLFNSFLLTQEMFPEGPRNLKHAVPVVLDKYPEAFKEVIRGRVFTEDALDVQAVTIDSQDFKKGDNILLNKEEQLITVGKIMFIICDHKDSFFLVTKYRSVPLLNYGVYEVQTQCSLGCELVHYKSDSDCILQAVYDFHDKLCFSLKYAVLEKSKLDSPDRND
ncbi:Metal regulatory transcription factor 1 [Frankliniella fusca]|uniref:Metal regulatory transcription factor 1 n=1 Tax=Frankliniella fusca TaxID=407009 RepID=A0AAE1HCV4_9NEOP|nr:Metal regulatory transcription factor 1 [Frankliniella fusca]